MGRHGNAVLNEGITYAVNVDRQELSDSSMRHDGLSHVDVDLR